MRCLGNPFSRRGFLSVGALGGLGVTLGDMLRMESARAESWGKWAYDIQRITRGWMIRKTNGSRKMTKKGPAAIPIQCAFRCYMARKELKKRKKLKKHKKKAQKKT